MLFLWRIYDPMPFSLNCLDTLDISILILFLCFAPYVCCHPCLCTSNEQYCLIVGFNIVNRENMVKVQYHSYAVTYEWIKANIHLYNGFRIYVDIMTGEKLLLTWTSLICPFLYPVGPEGMWVKWVNEGEGGVIFLASYKFHFMRVHNILV